MNSERVLGSLMPRNKGPILLFTTSLALYLLAAVVNTFEPNCIESAEIRARLNFNQVHPNFSWSCHPVFLY